MKDALHLRHTCHKGKALHKIQTGWIWTSTVRPGTVFQGKTTSQCLGWSSSPTNKISSILENNNAKLPMGLGSCQKSGATSAIITPWEFLFSLITPKLHPWSSSLALGAASSAVVFLLKDRNHQLNHLHVSPTNLFVSVSLF